MPIPLRPWLSAAVLGAFLNPCAHAIVSTSDPSNWTAASLNSQLGLSADALDGVARLSIGGSLCSGTLLSGGAYILTAAHCVTNETTGVLTATGVTATFDAGAVTATVSSSSQISVYSTWNGQLSRNNDLALLRLDTPVTNITGYSLYTGNLTAGTDVLLAGYGYTGQGNSGYSIGVQSEVHWGLNEYDAYGPPFGQNIGWDFDDGTSAHNGLPYYGVGSSTGLGSLEANIAPGDSGGPSFIMLASGQLQLTGVHSYIGTNGTAYGDVDSTLNSSYGELAADTLMTSSLRTWVSSFTSSVPEPSTSSLFGVALLGGLWRRRAARG